MMCTRTLQTKENTRYFERFKTSLLLIQRPLLLSFVSQQPPHRMTNENREHNNIVVQARDTNLFFSSLLPTDDLEPTLL